VFFVGTSVSVPTQAASHTPQRSPDAPRRLSAAVDRPTAALPASVVRPLAAGLSPPCLARWGTHEGVSLPRAASVRPFPPPLCSTGITRLLRSYGWSDS